MANRRFTILANNSPPQHKIGFFIEPQSCQYFTPQTFIESINFKKLFTGVEYWQSAKFVFSITGVGEWENNFIEHELDVISNVYMDIKNIPNYLLREIEMWARFVRVKDVTVRRMLISFTI